MATLILQGPGLTAQAAQQIATVCQGQLLQTTGYSVVTQATIADSLTAMRQQYSFDINCLPDLFDATNCRLLVMDMDSTLISIECVDEIADFMGLKPQVAAITEAAMRGELDFEASLRQRVRLLAGLPVSTLQEVYDQRLLLNPGAKKMLAGLQKKGIKTALVSGGFTFFTERLQQRLELDFTQANVLGEAHGKLTGEVVGPICGAQAKADFLRARCQQLNILPEQAIALGDGANDLLMMGEAGLSVAYHAKPAVQSKADTTLNHCGLEGVLGLLQIDQTQA